MKKEIFILPFLIIAAILILAGCIDNDNNQNVVNNTSIINNTNSTLDKQTTINTTPISHVDSKNNVSSIDSKTYTIRMRNYLSMPNYIEIRPQDSIIWYNVNDPVRLFTLVNDDGLWQNQAINYRQSFTYTFNKTGTYKYRVLGYPRMNGTIIVK